MGLKRILDLGLAVDEKSPPTPVPSRENAVVHHDKEPVNAKDK